MLLDMMSFYNFLKDNNISIIYSGLVWAGGLESVGDMLKKRMEYDEMSMSASMSVFSVFVEQMNNMLMYSADKQEVTDAEDEAVRAISSGMFILGKKDSSYYLQTGNLVSATQMELIKTRVDYINTLDKAQLRKYYKERLRAVDDNMDSKGAGIGLIEIARRASSKIEYDFEAYDDEHSFFTMYVTIG